MKTRQKSAKKRSVPMVHEYFKPIFNAVFRSKDAAGQPESARVKEEGEQHA